MVEMPLQNHGTKLSLGKYEIYLMENPHYPEQRKSEHGRWYSPDF